MDTIFAQATAPGRAGLSVIRISGPDAFAVAGKLMSDVPSARGVRRLTDGQDTLDEALVLSFPDKRSFTGEPVVELHLHGSIAIVSSVLGALSGTSARPAEPGEFTRRALENGRLDLAQVEGLADLIDAETEAQRRQAMRVFSGALGGLASDWRAKLIRAVALIEATIDFVDEDVPVDVNPEVQELIRSVADGMATQLNGARAAERVRDGFEVAIVGAPNVGKSTLLNALAGRDAAITSEVAGTTRDVIEVRMDISGLPVTLLDTAGIRQTSDIVEEIGISRALERARDADLRIFLLGPDDKPSLEPLADDIVVQAKADLRPDVIDGVSGQTGLGLDNLISRISAQLVPRTRDASVAIRERHRIAMQQGKSQIELVEGMLGDGDPADLIAEELRLALRQVDSLVGRVDVEDLLGEIFSSFCIGK